MVKVSPKLYHKYVITYSICKPVLYVRIKKSLYYLLRSTFLFYIKLVKYLEYYRFQINT